MEQKKKLYHFDYSYPSVGIQEAEVLEETKGRYTIAYNLFCRNMKGEVKVFFTHKKQINKSQMRQDFFFEEKSEAEKVFKETLISIMERLEHDRKIIDRDLAETSKALEAFQ